MVTSSSALVAFLASGAPCFQADLYTFTLIDGTVLRCTSFDRPITYASNTYAALGAYIQRSKLKSAVGLVASSVDITIMADPSYDVESLPLLVAIQQGRFSAARVTIRRAFMPTPADINLGGSGDGTIVRFAGEIGAVSEGGPLSLKLEGRGIVYKLNRPLPKTLYGPGCWHSLFDTGCGLSEASWRYSGSVLAGSTASVINTGLTNDANIPGAPSSGCSLSHTAGGNLPAATYYVQATYITALGETIAGPETSLAVPAGHVLVVASPASVTGATGWNAYVGFGSGDEQKQNASPIAIGTGWTMGGDGAALSGIVPPAFPTNGYFAQGAIKFTSGALAGLTAFIVASDSAGAIQLSVPMPAAPATGDTWTIVPGCDKSKSTCEHKFSNLVNFSGFPFVPVPEAGL